MNLRKGIGPNVVSGIAVTGLLAAMVFLMVGTTDRDAKIDRLSAGNDALYSQVQDQGEVPVAPPAKTVTGESGADGLQGPRGSTGDQGPRGDIGLTGVAGLLGAVGPVGSAGLNGLDGMTGATGAAGADGAPGPKGDTGAAGADGEPATSYTIAGPGGEQTCTRTEPFDKAAPTYECALTPKETP